MSNHGGPTRDGDVDPLHDLCVAAEYADLLREHGWDSLDGLFRVRDAESLSKPGLGGWRERLRLALTIGGERRVLYLKRFTQPPLRIQREVRRAGALACSVAGLEWAWARRLAADHLPAVRAVAFGETLRGRREVRSAILLEEAPGQSLERWCAEQKPCAPPELRLVTRSILDESATLVARFHSLGYVHRDLYLSHVFFDGGAGMGRRLRLIDLQRILRPKWRRLRWIIKDLAALHFSTPSRLVTRSDRLRWLTRYLREANLDIGLRPLMYRIEGKSAAMARHARRRLVREGKVCLP